MPGLRAQRPACDSRAAVLRVRGEGPAAAHRLQEEGRVHQRDKTEGAAETDNPGSQKANPGVKRLALGEQRQRVDASSHRQHQELRHQNNPRSPRMKTTKNSVKKSKNSVFMNISHLMLMRINRTKTYISMGD